jgi:hypothetical protein
MSPHGCFSAIVLMTLLAWTLVCTGAAGVVWLGGDLLERVAATAGSPGNPIVEAVIAGLGFFSGLGVAVIVAMWAIGTGGLGLVWFLLLRGAGHEAEYRRHRDEWNAGFRQTTIIDVTPESRRLEGPDDKSPPRLGS